MARIRTWARLGCLATALVLGSTTATWAAAPDGITPLDLDASFDVDGKVVLAVDDKLGETASDVVTYPDGRILIVSTHYAGGFVAHPVMTRLLQDGRIDRSFGYGGSVVAPWGSTSGSASVEILPDSRLLLGGRGGLGRFLSSGALDTSFATDGYLLLPSTLSWRGPVRNTYGDRIYVVGSEVIGDRSGIELRAFLFDGEVADQFGTGGVLNDEIPQGLYLDAFTFARMGGQDVMVVGGSSVTGRPFTDSGLVVTYRPHGRAFLGQNGVIVEGGRPVLSVVPSPNEGLLVTRDERYCDLHAENAGSVITETCSTPQPNQHYSDGHYNAFGRVVVVGRSTATQAESSDMFFVVTDEGSLTSRHIGGTDFNGPYEDAFVATTDPLGRIIVVGSTRRGESDSDLAVARLMGSYVPAGCGSSACTTPRQGPSGEASQAAVVDVQGTLAVSMQNTSVLFGTWMGGETTEDAEVGDITFWNTLPENGDWAATVAASRLMPPGGRPIPFANLTYSPGQLITPLYDSPGAPVPGSARQFDGAASNQFSNPLLLMTAQPGEKGVYTQTGGSVRLFVPFTATQDRYVGTLQYTVLN